MEQENKQSFNTANHEIEHTEGSGMSKQAVAAFFDRLAPSWDDDLVVEEPKINAILDAAKVAEGTRVLDIACGTGVLFPFYLERGVAKVTGVDISAQMVKIAVEKYRDPRINVICADFEDLTATERYDSCVIYNAFPHFPNPEGLVESAAAWLTPNGRITVAHSMGVSALGRHHSGSAKKISRKMLSAPEMQRLLSGWFCVDRVVSNDNIYIVSGRRLPQKGK